MIGDEDNRLDILNATPEEVRAILDWQHQRHHHLQSLSLGLLSSTLMIFAIVATLSVAIVGDIPTIPGESDLYVQAADGRFFGPSVAILTVGLNLTIVIVLAWMAFIMIVFSFYRLFDIITGGHFLPRLTQNTFLVQSGDFDISDGSVSNRFTLTVLENRDRLFKIYVDFLNGALRLPIFLLVAFSAGYIYLMCSNVALNEMFLINIWFAFPGGTLIAFFREKIFSVEKNQDEEMIAFDPQESLALEMVTESGRWGLTGLNKAESYTFITLTILNIVVVVMWGIAFFI